MGIVLLDEQMLASRMVAGAYAVMGIQDTVATSLQRYTEIAVDLGTSNRYTQ